MKKRLFHIIVLTILYCLLSIDASAHVYFVSFDSKDSCGYSLQNPQQFLTQRALDRRAAAGIVVDSLDLPVPASYINQIKNSGGYVLNVSRWFNGVSVRINDSTSLRAIAALPFVVSMECTQYDSWEMQSVIKKSVADSLWRPTTHDVITSEQLMAQMNLKPLLDLGYRGSGKVVAVIDGGFPGVNSASSFDSVRPNILGTRNYAYIGKSVYNTGVSHGSMVLSVMAGYISTPTSSLRGTAPDASYYLFLTEQAAKESPLEMDNWVAAVEYADSLGVDVCSTSLGYFNFDNSEFNLSYAKMNGRSTRSSLAATLAAHRNMLIVVAAGNEGGSNWHHITSPSDAEDILCVGAVDIDNNHASFSSCGPSFDGRVKPDVCALGVMCPLSDSNGSFAQSSGTSFACPALAGAATSLWSALPHLTALQLRQLLIDHASQHLNPDSTLGYGIPDVYQSYLAEAPMGLNTAETTLCRVAVNDGQLYYNTSAEGDVKIFDVQGVMLSCFHVEQFCGTIDISAWPQGIYLFHFTSDGSTCIEKIIK
ncbi:MAG: S8 family peptidase [Bacteroidales bacterium]|nr:S8 family peptidase [Bacteroidales bacterium]